MHSDPVADMLTRIRNGCRAKLTHIKMPFSVLKANIAEILKREGFIGNYRSVAQEGSQIMAQLEIELRYDEASEPIIAGIKRLSTPGRRRYYRCDRIPKIRNGLGLIILTTSNGLKTDHEARRARIGGEALCSVW